MLRQPASTSCISNSVWGQKGNFLDVPTDCPQRDERLGWTGDIAVYAATAAYQFDVADFLHKWLLDLAAETAAQRRRHACPIVVPDVLKYADSAADFENPFTGPLRHLGRRRGLGAARRCGTRTATSTGSPPTTPAWLLHLESVEPRLSESGLWDPDFQLGDWLDPDAPPDEPDDAKADTGVVATACFYRSAAFAAEAARVLGKTRTRRAGRRSPSRIRHGFATHYVHADGTIVVRLRNRLRAGHLLRPARRRPARARPAIGWPSSSPHATTRSPPDSPARRS